MLARAQLPEDIEALKDLVVEIDTEKTKSLASISIELERKSAEIHRLNEIIMLLRRQHYGPRSEKLKASSSQLGLFNEAEITQSVVDSAETSEPLVETTGDEKPATSSTRGQPKRKPLSEELPGEDLIIEIPESERQCHCGCTMTEIGEEVSEKLEVIPQVVKVIRTRRKKYACQGCKENVKTAPLSPQILPKSMAASGLISFIIVSKFIQHLPLYRLEDVFEHLGASISRTTMARWIIDVAEAFMPLFNLMQETLLEGHYIHSDETKVQVLDEPGKEAESLSYMWIQARAGPKPIVLYTYDPTRKKEVVEKLLQGFKGYLQVDGYGGYDEFCQRDGIIRVGCMAHARRKFFDAMKVNAKKGLSNQGFKFIQRLYKVEEESKDLSFEERLKVRQEKSKPIADEFRLWISEHIKSVPPATALGKALGYADREWVYLTRYLENGELAIDNNFIENKIRPFAIGRKNWLFSQSVEGAESSALLFSLIETAKANNVDAYVYIRHLCDKIPLANTVDDYESLLPWNVNLN